VANLELSAEMQGVKEPAEDGVSATALVSDVQIIPGLLKLDGYSKLSSFLRTSFELYSANDRGVGGNYLEFAYDWRLDNRINARRLAEKVDRMLSDWKAQTGVKNARVIFVAHSMGGLIARYYLEALGGWRCCRALFSLGTPFRGSLNSLSYLANGFKLGPYSLTAMVRSCPSVYQLMPTYAAVHTGERYESATNMSPHVAISAILQQQASAFHAEINSAHAQNGRDERYRTQGYASIAFVGVNQKTFQSAHLVRGIFDIGYYAPAGIDDNLIGGDGTVPMLSAIPDESYGMYPESYLSERHSALQSNRRLLEDLRTRLMRMQSPELRSIRSDVSEDSLQEFGGFSLNLEDAYPEGQPVTCGVSRSDALPDDRVLVTVCDSADCNSGESINMVVGPSAIGRWEWQIAPLPVGIYRLSVTSNRDSTSITDIFAIMPVS
jgi:pimeloyl-ACP methyl ester carboxylesterase